jgi:hypothetical protein
MAISGYGQISAGLRVRPTLSAVIVRESGRSSIPETLMMESRGRGVLDRPVKPDDDDFL